MADRAEFNDHWPELAERLRRYLAKRRIPRSLWDDVVQETGLRMYLYWERANPRGSLWGLTRKIAGIVLWNSYNSVSASVPIVGIPERAAPENVEQTVLARVELARVEAALAQLTPLQQAALLAEIGGPIPHTLSADALKMLRLRARRRLDVILGQSQGVAYHWRGRMRDLWRRLTTPKGRTSSLSEGIAMGLASGLVVLSMVIAPPGGAPFPGPLEAEAGEAADFEGRPAPVRSAVRTIAEARRLREEISSTARRAAKRTSRLVVLGVEPMAIARDAYQESLRVARIELYSGVTQLQNRIERDTPLGKVAEVRDANRGVRKKVRSLTSVTGSSRKKKDRKDKS